MQELYQGFLNVDKIFWGDDIFRWWFYLSIFSILILEKKRTVRISFGWFCIVIFVGLFNPLSNVVMSKMRLDWPYRARLYSWFPLPQVLGIGTVLVIDKLCKGFQKEVLVSNEKTAPKWGQSVAKLVLVAGICTLIIMGGTDVYKQDWMKPAQNFEKVPTAVLELKQRMGNLKDISIAVPASLSSYLRQVAPQFYTPYGRDYDMLGNLISQDNPDPLGVMRMAGEESCDFIVVIDNETNIENFRHAGYEAYEKVTGFLVYKVTGVPMIKRTYNEKRQVIKEEYLDKHGIPLEYGFAGTEEGYAGIAYEYDRYGNRTKEIYLKADGSRRIMHDTYTAIAKTYTRYAHLISSLKFLNENDEPVILSGCYETRYTYNSKRQVEEESYYNGNGEPMINIDTLCASKKIKYDDNNCIIGEEYYDAENNVVINSSGYASYVRVFDQNGRKIREEYHGLDGKYILNNLGYSVVVWNYNENGLLSNETYLDVTENPTYCSNGYAQIQWDYNDACQMICESYWDVEESPIKNIDGYYGFVCNYDENGKMQTMTYLFEKNK